ncbi:MAG: VIT1/CCC1 transporter family protein [Chloroflexi bacterium]|nr:VIT1/CCC1 transporter family protein [Chloroflexota bacterium]
MAFPWQRERISSKSEREYYDREWQREAWEVEHFPEGERTELVEVYREQGYSDEEANTLVEIQSRDPQRWVNAMMINELGLLKDDRKPLLSGLMTLFAFVIAGSVPMLIYLLGLIIPISAETAFPISIALSAIALFGLGAAKVVITRLNPVRSGLEMLIVGGLAAAVAYIVGALLKGIGG